MQPNKGNPYDNAVAGSFLKTLKTEEVYLWEYQTLADVEKQVPQFIEQVYNEKCLHSSLNYRLADKFERMFHMNNHHNPVSEESNLIFLNLGVHSIGNIKN